jgi:hypothetical protein
MENDKPVHDTTTIGIHPSVSISSLIPITGTHLRCACLCANNCKEIEQEFRDETTIELREIGTKKISHMLILWLLIALNFLNPL